MITCEKLPDKRYKVTLPENGTEAIFESAMIFKNLVAAYFNFIKEHENNEIENTEYDDVESEIINSLCDLIFNIRVENLENAFTFKSI